jgi:hypothetical protein
MTSACYQHNFVIKSYAYGISKATCNSWVSVSLAKLLVVQRTEEE